MEEVVFSNILSEAPGFLKSFRKAGVSSSSEVALFLHGFPGDANKQNEDLARAIALKLGMDAVALHYRGLGEAGGKFSFLESINSGIENYNYLSQNFSYRKVHLVGHSWGGLVALNILLSRASNFGRVVLLSPLFLLPVPSTSRTIVEEIFKSRPSLFEASSVDQIIMELDIVRKKFQPSSRIEELADLGVDIIILQAELDSEVPAEVNREFSKQMGKATKYIELPQSHRFDADRGMVAELISRHLGG